jgi:hypothetical protein
LEPNPRSKVRDECTKIDVKYDDGLDCTSSEYGWFSEKFINLGAPQGVLIS